MTKIELENRVAQLEAMLPHPVTADSVRSNAHLLGQRYREQGVVAGRAVRTGTAIGSAAVGGFFAGLFGRA